MITLQIPEVLPSLNDFACSHWTKYRSYRRHWSMLILVAKSQARIGLWKPYPKSLVSIVRHGKRLLDPDNLVGSTKLAIDGLRDQHLIVDDSPAHMELVVTQIKISAKEYPKTLIKIMPASG